MIDRSRIGKFSPNPSQAQPPTCGSFLRADTIGVSFLIAHHKCDGGPEYKLWEQAISCMKDGDRR